MQGIKQNCIMWKLLCTGKTGDNLENFGTQLSSVSEREWDRLSGAEEAAEELSKLMVHKEMGN